GANFDRVVQMIRTRLHANPLPLVLPIGSEDTFRGIVDLVYNKAIMYADNLGTRIEDAEIPADMKDRAEEARMAIMEACAEYDDELLERFLSGDTEFTPEEIIRVVRKATIDMKITPVLCG